MGPLLMIAGCTAEDRTPSLPGRPVDGPPNFLIVLLDDFGTDKIASYGESESAPATATLDALASDGLLFRNAWSSPSCSPSRGMLLTGRYTSRYGLGANIDHDPWSLPTRERLIPSVLADADPAYASAAFGKWGLAGGVDPAIMVDPLDRGFLHHRGTWHNVLSYFSWIDFDDGVDSDRSGYLTTATADDAIAAIETLPEPWFVYLALNAPHLPPHVPPDPLNPGGVVAGDSVADRYDAAVVAADLELGRVIEAIEPGTRERTVIVALGDNGTPSQAIRPPLDPGHGKLTLFEGGINVPLIVVGPGVVRGESEALISVLDVAPTLYELAGVDVAGLEDGAGDPLVLDGVSFAAQLRDPLAPGRAFVLTEYLRAVGPPPWSRAGAAVRDHRYKLVANFASRQLYDLSGRFDDGEDLLLAPLTPEADAALETLSAELAELASIPYDGP